MFLSFSPAIDSGAIDTAPENKKETIKNGRNIAIIFPASFFSSNWGETLVENIFTSIFFSVSKYELKSFNKEENLLYKFSESVLLGL